MVYEDYTPGKRCPTCLNPHKGTKAKEGGVKKKT